MAGNGSGKTAKYISEAVMVIAVLAFIILCILLYNNGGHWPF